MPFSFSPSNADGLFLLHFMHMIFANPISSTNDALSSQLSPSIRGRYIFIVRATARSKYRRFFLSDWSAIIW